MITGASRNAPRFGALAFSFDPRQAVVPMARAMNNQTAAACLFFMVVPDAQQPFKGISSQKKAPAEAGAFNPLMRR